MKKCFSVARYDLQLVCDGQIKIEEIKVTSPKISVELIQKYLATAYREKVVVLALDGKNEMVGISTAGEGSLDHCFIRPRHIFDRAFRMQAASIIVAHNHPKTGDPEPSREDIEMMKELIELGRRNDCPLRDFIILGKNDTYWAARNETYDL